jgi:hypothetical protein
VDKPPAATPEKLAPADWYDGERDVTTWAEMLAVSPGLYKELAARLEPALRRADWKEVRDLTDVGLEPLCPSYEVGKDTKVKVSCRTGDATNRTHGAG